MKNKPEYILGIVTQASIIERFFGNILIDHRLDPEDEMNKIISAAKCSPSSIDDLTDISANVSKAKAMVHYLVEKYGGETDIGHIRDYKGLYKAVFHKNPPKSAFYADSYNFAIGFFMPKHLFKDYVLGDTSCAWSIPKQFFDTPLEHLGTRKEPLLLLESLSFRVNKGNNPPANKIDYVLEQIFGETREQYNTAQHEIRHICSTFVAKEYTPFTETVVALFDHKVFRKENNPDIETWKNLVEDSKKKYEDCDDIFKKDFSNIVKKKEKVLHQLENFDYSIFIEAARFLKPEVLSYIATLVPFEELEQFLKDIVAYSIEEKNKRKSADMIKS